MASLLTSPWLDSIQASYLCNEKAKRRTWHHTRHERNRSRKIVPAQMDVATCVSKPQPYNRVVLHPTRSSVSSIYQGCRNDRHIICMYEAAVRTPQGLTWQNERATRLQSTITSTKYPYWKPSVLRPAMMYTKVLYTVVVSTARGSCLT